MGKLKTVCKYKFCEKLLYSASRASALCPLPSAFMRLLCFSPGYLCMTDEWFSEYVYEVVVDRKHVPEEVLAVLEQEPIVLPAWDPMGALAD